MKPVSCLLASILFILGAGFVSTSEAQQRIGYIDSDFILDRVPEYEGILQRLNSLSETWQEEIEDLTLEIEDLRREFEAREILYTDEVREQRRQEIRQKEQQKEQLIERRFGPDGDYFSQQKELLEPLQQRILEATVRVAERGNYDYVFDRSGDYMFLYTRQNLNVSVDVLLEMGIQVDEDDMR